jgi:hypothetical protein
LADNKNVEKGTVPFSTFFRMAALMGPLFFFKCNGFAALFVWFEVEWGYTFAAKTNGYEKDRFCACVASVYGGWSCIG